MAYATALEVIFDNWRLPGVAFPVATSVRGDRGLLRDQVIGDQDLWRGSSRFGFGRVAGWAARGTLLLRVHSFSLSLNHFASARGLLVLDHFGSLWERLLDHFRGTRRLTASGPLRRSASGVLAFASGYPGSG